MKKKLLSTALLPFLYSTTYAETTTTSPVALPTPPKPAITAPETQPAAAAQLPVNCSYHIPADKTSIEQPLITTWAEQAASQSFTFNPATIDQELTALKACYTDQGWQGFNSALEKSGNIEAIKSQHLTVSSHVDSGTTVAPVKNNQWKVTIPVQVVYQNDKEKLTQLLSVELLVGRKISGDLGIMQMIATPRPEAGAQKQPLPTETKSNSEPQA